MRALLLSAVLLAGIFAGCVSDEPVASVDEPIDEVVLPVVNSEVQALRDAIAANGTVTLTAETSFLAVEDPRYTADAEFEVELTASTMLNGTWAEVDAQAVGLPQIDVYEGHVVGNEEQEVRLTITNDWASGTIRVDDQPYRVRVNMDGNFPVGFPLALPEEATEAQPIFRPGVGFLYDGLESGPGGLPHNCLSPVPFEHMPTVPEVLTHDELTVDIVLDGDGMYMHRLGEHAFPMMVAFLNEVDAIYEHQLGMRFHITGLHLHTNLTAMPEPSEVSPLGALSEFWNARENITRDSIHLFTGFESSYAQANCIGGAGMEEIAYTFTTIQWAQEEFGILRHTQTFAHELGHIYNAHHHYGNPAEGGQSVTIMFQGSQKVNPAFSALSRSVIRGWTEEYTQD